MTARVRIPFAWLATLLAITLAVAGLLCAGCNAGGDKSRFAGTWNLQYGESSENATSLSKQNVESMRALGIEPYLNLDENGNLALVTFEKAQYGTWEMKGREKAEALVEGQEAEIVLDGDYLLLEQAGTTLVFSKGDPRASEPSAQTEKSDASQSAKTSSAESGSSGGPGSTGASGEGASTGQSTASSASSAGPSVEEGSSSAASPSSDGQTEGLCDMVVRGTLLDEPIVIADDELCNIVVNGVGVDKFGDPGYNMQLVNKSDRPIDIWVAKPFMVNGEEVRTYLYETLEAGKDLSTFIQFDAAEVRMTYPSSLVNVSGELLVDDESDTTIAKYQFRM